MIEMRREQDDLVFVRTVPGEKADDVIRRLRRRGGLNIRARIDRAVQDSGWAGFAGGSKRLAELVAHLLARLGRDRSGEEDPLFEELGPEVRVFFFQRGD